MNNINLMKKDNKVVVSSREIAENFEKLHKNVIQTIKNLECSRKFNELNFQPVEYKDKKGEKRIEYLITRDGFTLLAMGFTGKKAMQFKEAYINAFNKMEDTLRSISKGIVQSQTIENKTKNAEARLNNSRVRVANAWLKLAEKTDIPEYKQIIVSNVSAVLSGKELISLPSAERKTYTANEIGDKLGITGNMVGRIANTNGLKTPKYGKLFYDKSRYSNKEVETFRYYDNIIPEIENILNKE